MPQPVSVEATRAGRLAEGRRLEGTEPGWQVPESPPRRTPGGSHGESSWAGLGGWSQKNPAGPLGSERSPSSRYPPPHPHPGPQLFLPEWGHLEAYDGVWGPSRGAACGPEVGCLHQPRWETQNPLIQQL